MDMRQRGEFFLEKPPILPATYTNTGYITANTNSVQYNSTVYSAEYTSMSSIVISTMYRR